MPTLCRLRAAPATASNDTTPEVTPSEARLLPPYQLPTISEQPQPSGPVPIAPRADPTSSAPVFTNQANVPLFGSLNVRDAIFYCKASVSQLKTIVGSAPPAARAHLPPNPTKDVLLETVLGYRQEEAVRARLSQRSPEDSLLQLMNLSSSQLKVLCNSDPSQLEALMRAALLADRSMKPREIPSAPHEMFSTVLTWQVDALKAARAIPDSTPPPAIGASASPQGRERVEPVRLPLSPHPAPPSGTAAPQIITTAAPPTVPVQPRAQPLAASPTLEQIITGLQSGAGQANLFPTRNADSDDEDETRGGKRQKMLVPQGFTYGSTANIEQVLKHYPGKSTASPALACKELLGPIILAQLIGGGANVPKFLQDFKHWRKTATGLPSHAEMEAHTLGRTIHMEMLKHDSPLEALEHRPSLEIILRRLFALLYVEEAVNTGMFQERPAAWHFVHPLHESTPMGTVMCDHIDDAMTQRMTLEKKRMAAIKALEEARASRSNIRGSQRNHLQRNQPQRNNQTRRPGRQ